MTSSDPKVENIRRANGQGIAVTIEATRYLLTKLDDAEEKVVAANRLLASTENRLSIVRRGIRAAARKSLKRAGAAEERERALIAAVREEITKVIEDLDRARANGTVYTYGNIQTRLRHALSHLLPSTPTEEGKPMSERKDLARDIWESGVTEPDLIAEYLIREGWGKRRQAFTEGIVSTVNAINAMPESPLRSPMRGMIR
jgi:hypothetical protein